MRRDLSRSQATYSASPLLHSRNASFSCLSSCNGVMSFVHGGRLGTRSLCRFSRCFCKVLLSSSSERRYGLCCDAVGALIILTLRRSTKARVISGEMAHVSKKTYVPAVNCVPASCAVLRNSSKSRSWVIDCSRVVESTSVVYYNTLTRG